MKTVVFAGSGFSTAAFNFAGQNNLFKDFKTWAEDERIIENLPEELIVLLQEIGDIELVLSHFLNAGYIGFPGARHQSQLHQRGLVTFRSALAIYYRDRMISTGIPYYKAETEELLGYWLREKCDDGDEITFITTNYDLGLEQVVTDVIGDHAYYYPGLDDSTQMFNKVPIIKLHGSINWMEDRGKSSWRGFTNPGRGKVDYSVLKKLSMVPFDNRAEFALVSNGRKFTPVMVPFFQQKRTWEIINERWWGQVFEGAWQAAFESIQSADEIQFWGYGLPSADHHMFSFLLTALRNTKTYCTVVDHRKDGSETNLMKLARLNYRDKSEKLRVETDGLVDHWSLEIGT